MRRKVSTLEMQMSKDIFWAILLLLILCTIVGVRSVIFENLQATLLNGTGINRFWYIPKSSLEVNNDFVNGFFAFMTMVIILQVTVGHVPDSEREQSRSSQLFVLSLNTISYRKVLSLNVIVRVGNGNGKIRERINPDGEGRESG